MYERFTDRARKVMALANQEAQRLNHDHISPEHVLLGLTKEGSGVGANVLKNLGVDHRKVRSEVEKLVESVPEPSYQTMGKLPLTQETTDILEAAVAYSGEFKHRYVGTEHIAYALSADTKEDSIVRRVFQELQLEPSEFGEEIKDVLGIDIDSIILEEGDLEQQIRARMGEEILSESQLAMPTTEGAQPSFIGPLSLDAYKKHFPGDHNYISLFLIARTVEPKLAKVVERLYAVYSAKARAIEAGDYDGAVELRRIKSNLLNELVEVAEKTSLKKAEA